MISYALLNFKSYLTPLVLVLWILVTCGMREVSSALTNPFGDDEVDFPIQRWIVMMRANCSLMVHPDNFNLLCPQRKAKQAAEAAALGDVAPGSLQHGPPADPQRAAEMEMAQNYYMYQQYGMPHASGGGMQLPPIPGANYGMQWPGVPGMAPALRPPPLPALGPRVRVASDAATRAAATIK